MLSKSLLALAASLATSSAAVYAGFNYGSTFTDGSAKQESDFQAEFTTAKNLVGTNGQLTSARLYTMIVSLLPPVASPLL
jgi:glucan endo-1,3-beta-D-glucosidase